MVVENVMKKFGLLLIALSLIVSLLLPASVVEASTLYEHYTTGDDTRDYTYQDGRCGQTFTPLVSHRITSVKLKLYRVGSPGIVHVEIQTTDVDGVPTGTVLCNGSTDGNTLPIGSPYEWREITLGDGDNLNAATKYAIVIYIPNGDISNCIHWRRNSSGTYTRGQYCWISSSVGGEWHMSLPASDMMFEEWGLYAVPTITTNDATYVKRTTTRLNSYLNDDGGEPCDVRFQYSTTSGGGGGYENFSTYTELDNNFRIHVTDSRCCWTALTRNEDAYLYDDKGAGYFSGDFEHWIDINTTFIENDAQGVIWGMANNVEDW